VKILQVSNGFPPTAVAGAEQYTYAISHALSRRHEVYVFCHERAPDQAEYTLIDQEMDGLRVRRVVNNFRDVSSFEDLYVNPGIERLFEEYVDLVHPDLIQFQHCIGLSANLPNITARRDIPFTITLLDYWYICPTVKLLTQDLALCPGPHQGADCRRCFGPAFDVWSRLHRIPGYETLRDRLVPQWLHSLALRWLETSPLSRKTCASEAAQGTDGTAASPFVRRMQSMRTMLNLAPRLLAPSHFVREMYTGYGVPGDHILVVPWGLDKHRWTHQLPRARVPQLRFGYIGTLQPAKGVDILVRAFHRLDDDQVELRLHGGGKPDDPFVDRLTRVQDPRIHFLGRYDNLRLPELLARVDVVVIPSIWHETFSLVAREALLAGLPVIASAVGALPEVIVDNVNGLLVPPSDEDALHEAMARLVDDRALLARLKPSAPAVTDIRDHADELERIYKELRKPA
jgi:glycosyltransferase involved in cell wall biosynthesis